MLISIYKKKKCSEDFETGGGQGPRMPTCASVFAHRPLVKLK